MNDEFERTWKEAVVGINLWRNMYELIYSAPKHNVHFLKNPMALRDSLTIT
jgi:hypothetical protein